MIDRIRRVDPRPIRELWPREDRDFTPWLAANLDHYLADLNLGRLSLVEVEATLPDTQRSLDILAETADERRVAIENQFGEADHDHLTRGLAYAVGHGAAALVVVAERFRPEFVATADYLNQAAESLGLDEGGIGVYLVTVSVEALDDWYIPRFQVIVRPNLWLSATAEDRTRGLLSGVPAYLDLVPSARRDLLTRIIEDWASRANASVTHNARAAVALRLRKPGRGGTVAVLTPQSTGSIWLNRGYLLPVVEEIGVSGDQLDELIKRAWPSARAGEQGFYFIIDDPTYDEYVAFADAICELAQADSKSD